MPDPTYVTIPDLTAATDGSINDNLLLEAAIPDGGGYVSRKVTKGQLVADLKEDIAQLDGLSDDVKAALMEIVNHVAWDDQQGQARIDALEDALYPTATLESISAIYTQTGTVYDIDTLDSLKADLVVTAHYSDSTTATVTTYILSGTLADGTSTITVSYNGKTTTFTVIVTAAIPSGYVAHDYIVVPTQKNDTVAASWIALKQYDNLNALSFEFSYKPLPNHADGGAIFGRRSESGSASSFAFYSGNASTGFHLHGVAASADSGLRPTVVENALNIIRYKNTAATPSSIQSNDNSPISFEWVNNNVLNLAPVLFANPINNNVISIIPLNQIGYIKVFDLSDNLIGHYVPVVKTSGNIIGMWDIVEQTFYSSSTASYSTIGNANCYYAVGDWS